MVDEIMRLDEGTRIQILSPVVRGRKGEHTKIFEQARRSGYVRVSVDGHVYDLNEEIKLEKNIKHNISVIIDRLVVKKGIEKRLSDSLENSLKLGGGLSVCEVVGVPAEAAEAVHPKRAELEKHEESRDIRS